MCESKAKIVPKKYIDISNKVCEGFWGAVGT